MTGQVRGMDNRQPKTPTFDFMLNEESRSFAPRFTEMRRQDFCLLGDLQTDQRVRLQFWTEVLSSPNQGDLQLCASGLNPGDHSSIPDVPNFSNLTLPRPTRHIQFGTILHWRS